MPEAKEKKIKNIDDLFKDLAKQHSKELGESFKSYDSFMKEENQNTLFNDLFNPAQDKMYQSIVASLGTSFDNKDDAKVKGKEKEVKKAVTEGMKKYFEHAQPSILKATEGMDDKEQFDYLSQWYDDHVGADGENIPSIKAVVESHLKNNKTTVGHIKKGFYEMKSRYAQGAASKLRSKFVSHHFSKYHPTEVAAHLKPSIEKGGIEISDKVRYGTHDLGALISIYDGIKSGELRGGYETYGLKKKEDKKKKDEEKDPHYAQAA